MEGPDEGTVTFNDDPYSRLAVTLLARVAGFAEVPAPALEALVRSGSLQRLREGVPIAVRGQVQPGLQLIVDGVVALGPQLNRAPQSLFTFSGPGDVLGFTAVLDGRPTIWDCRTRSPSIVLTIPRVAVLAAPQAVRDACALQVAHLNRILCDRLTDALALPLSARLARQLDYLVRRFGVPRGEAMLIDLRISQEELASMLGSSRQQVNVELKRMEQHGAISLRRESITVLDLAAVRGDGYGTVPLTLTRPDGAP